MSALKIGGGIVLQLAGALLLLGGMGSCFYGLGYADPPVQTAFVGLALAQAILGFVLIYVGGRKLRGTPLSVGDKATEPTEDDPGQCKDADDALKYAIIGIFCFGGILGPAAVMKALQARKAMAANPRLKGEGKATAGLIIGLGAFLLWLLVIITQSLAIRKTVYGERHGAVGVSVLGLATLAGTRVGAKRPRSSAGGRWPSTRARWAPSTPMRFTPESPTGTSGALHVPSDAGSGRDAGSSRRRTIRRCGDQSGSGGRPPRSVWAARAQVPAGSGSG